MPRPGSLVKEEHLVRSTTTAGVSPARTRRPAFAPVARAWLARVVTAALTVSGLAFTTGGPATASAVAAPPAAGHDYRRAIAGPRPPRPASFPALGPPPAGPRPGGPPRP